MGVIGGHSVNFDDHVLLVGVTHADLGLIRFVRLGSQRTPNWLRCGSDLLRR